MYVVPVRAQMNLVGLGFRGLGFRVCCELTWPVPLSNVEWTCRGFHGVLSLGNVVGSEYSVSKKDTFSHVQCPPMGLNSCLEFGLRKFGVEVNPKP